MNEITEQAITDEESKRYYSAVPSRLLEIGNPLSVAIWVYLNGMHIAKGYEWRGICDIGVMCDFDVSCEAFEEAVNLLYEKGFIWKRMDKSGGGNYYIKPIHEDKMELAPKFEQPDEDEEG